MNEKILVLGDIFLDIFNETKAFKISPERPVPVLKPKGTEFFLGGAANVANNLKSIGGEPFLISKLSKDINSKKIIFLLKKNNISHKIIFSKKYSTSVKKRIVENNHQFLRLDDESLIRLKKNDEKKIIKFINKNIKKFKSLVISDYSKGFFTRTLVEKVISIFKKNKKKIFTDPKNRNVNFYKNSNFICPNQNEFEQFLDNEKLNYDKKSTTSLIKKSNAEAFIITKGQDGVQVIYKSGKSFNINQKNINVYDVTGAGDTFVSCLSYLYIKNVDLINAIKIAICACSKIVQKKHTSILQPEEFKNVINEFCEENKISFELKIKLWKLVNFKIGVANGCFDVLHSGHLHLINKAKEQCDKLVILLNSDRSVFKIKGFGRPKLKLNVRIKFLKMIKDIDRIEIFDELTPIKLIKKIMPDIIFKGSDYKKNKVVGYKELIKNKGKIIIINNLKDFSSTKLINK